MNGIMHPYTKDLYERDETADRIRVTRTDGTIGYYTAQGRWIEGVKFDADRHLCGWIMSPRGAHRLTPPPA